MSVVVTHVDSLCPQLYLNIRSSWEQVSHYWSEMVQDKFSSRCIYQHQTSDAWSRIIIIIRSREGGET